MDILSRLAEPASWEAYFAYKTEKGMLTGKDAEDMRSFIDNREYLPVTENIENGGEFLPPVKSLISKKNTRKKRVVYTFSREENYVLKLITFMLRDYDDAFAPNLYSFRKERGVKRATKEILRVRNLPQYFVYKADISDYFNSADVEILIPMLSEILSQDERLLEFFKRLLRSSFVNFEGEMITEQKGMMAGVPLSTFFANVYLRELDFYFYERKIPYMRYSDDIIVFGKSREEIEEYRCIIGEFLKDRRLRMNPDKESVFEPYEEWTFLGFSYNNGVVDISDISFQKLKAKMRRKARALERWARRKNLPCELAARAFVKRFNTKLYDNPVHSELTWTRWFFPVINTDRTLRRIDEYMEDTIRYLATGTRTKARYNFRYEDIKALGFRSLVNEYHKYEKSEKEK